MPEQRAEAMQLQEMVALDWAARLRQLEDLHPRVNALENAVSDIRGHLREFTVSQKEQQKETKESLEKFLEQNKEYIEKRDKTTAEAIDGLGKTVSGLSRKVWFFAGAIWVLIGIAALGFTLRKELFSAALILTGANS